MEKAAYTNNIHYLHSPEIRPGKKPHSEANRGREIKEGIIKRKKRGKIKPPNTIDTRKILWVERNSGKTPKAFDNELYRNRLMGYNQRA